MLLTITAFTAGHGITLSLVTLSCFEYLVTLVEFGIALSIFAPAVELTRLERNDLLWRHSGGWPAASDCCTTFALPVHWRR